MISEKRLNLLKKKYAELIIKKGLNFEKGRIVEIAADVDQPDFVKMLVEECYKHGARRVNVIWTYRPIQRMQYDRTSVEELTTVYKYQVEHYKFQAKELTPRIILESEDPNYLAGVDPDKIAKTQHVKGAVRRPYRDIMDKVETPWVICTVPSEGWAKTIFPKDNVDVAVKKLWEAIFDCCRVSKGDPIKNWDDFNKEIKLRARWLDSLNIDYLHYTSKNGTDLKVGLNKYARFCGGAHDSVPGANLYNPNMPAVETFTSPDCNRINGIVYSSKPLCHNGQLIDEFSFKLKDGKIIEIKAKKGEKLLKDLIHSHPSLSYLGECALVPFSSPVNKTGLIFYKTVFDENAACHFALGYSLATTYKKEVKNKSKEELIKLGLNKGPNHIDFMVGTKDLSIVAYTRDGKKVQVFKNGNWANKVC